MLSKRNRFSLRTDRVRLEKEGLTRHTPLFTIVTASSSDPNPRFVFLISKKLAPLSVNRHRLKRLLSEVIRLNVGQFPPSRDFLIIPKKPCLTATPDQILTDLVRHSSS